MNYYIDFEATQFSEEIISIGCVREDGETFYSLVAPIDGEITPFITNLTGITKEAISEATSPDVVFERFYDWVFSTGTDVNFFTWGNNDIDFVRHTFKRTNSFRAKLMLGYLCGSIRDYAKGFCKNMKVSSCSLLKAYQLFKPEATQNHNALDDAYKLYIVAKKLEETPDWTLFKEQLAKVCEPKNKSSKFKIGEVYTINAKGAIKLLFNNLEEATEWAYEEIVKSIKDPESSNLPIKNNIKKKIQNSINQDKPYMGKKWKMR